MTNLRQQNLAQDVYKNPENAQQIRNLESIEIKDGKLIIKPRPKAAGTAPETAPLEDLPEDVLAPPDSGQPKAEPAKGSTPKGLEGAGAGPEAVTRSTP